MSHAPLDSIGSATSLQQDMQSAGQETSRRLTAAHREHNSRTLPSRLPTELLVNIFRILKEIDPPSEEIPGHFDPGWIRVTHVCNFFRTVAIGDVQLWASLDRNCHWDLFLARSCGVSLRVRTGGVQEAVFVPAILANIMRVRELYIQHATTRATDEILVRNAPNLESLYIGLSTDWRYSLDGDFLAKRSPMLHTLHLEGVGLPRDIPSPLSLRELWLFKCNNWSTYSYADLMTCLRNMPLLEKLETCGSVPEGGDSDDTAVYLPHLQRLISDEFYAGSLYLWRSLVLPRFYEAKIMTGDIELGNNVQRKLGTIMQQHLAQPISIPYTTFILGLEEWEDSVFSLSVQTSSPRDLASEQGSRMSHRKLTFDLFPYAQDLVLPTVSLFPPDPVRDFVLHGYIHLDPPAMLQMLRPFIALETIEATGNATVGKLLVSFIVGSDNSVQAGEPSAHHVYLPALHTLLLKSVNFDTEVPNEYRDMVPALAQDDPRIHDLLRVALQRRAATHLRIHTLLVHDCFTADEPCIQSCGGFVGTLDWPRPCSGNGDVKP